MLRRRPEAAEGPPGGSLRRPDEPARKLARREDHHRSPESVSAATGSTTPAARAGRSVECQHHRTNYDDGGDGPPVERSARIAPTRAAAKRSAPVGKQRVDPRFDPMFGAVNKSYAEAHYKFVEELQAQEQKQRLERMKQLRCVLRRHEIEERIANARKDASAGPPESLDDYDLTDDEEDVFGPEQAQVLAELKLTPAHLLRQELETLKREAQVWRSQSMDKMWKSKRTAARNAVIKAEVKAVKDGVKAVPYFPKRAALRTTTLSATFDTLEAKGGKGAVDRYLERKQNPGRNAARRS